MPRQSRPPLLPKLPVASTRKGDQAGHEIWTTEPRIVRPHRYLIALGLALFATLGAAMLLGGWYGLGLWAGCWLLAAVLAMLWLAMRLKP